MYFDRPVTVLDADYLRLLSGMQLAISCLFYGISQAEFKDSKSKKTILRSTAVGEFHHPFPKQTNKQKKEKS